MKKPDVLMLIPVYQTMETETSNAVQDLVEKGWDLLVRSASGMLDRTRAEMATDALRSGHEWLLWIDADIAFRPDDAERLLRTAEHERLDFVCADYPTKQFGARHTTIFERSSVRCGVDGQLEPIKRCGFGFVLMRRSVLLRVGEHMEKVRKEPKVQMNRLGDGTVGYPYFWPILHIDKPEDPPFYMGEDYSFCERAREAGINLWCDTRIRLGHIGRAVFTWENIGEQGKKVTFRTVTVTGIDPDT